MKAVIYGGIILFSAASVYGITDYYQASKKGTLDKIYKEEAPASESKAVVTAPTETKEPAIAANSNTQQAAVKASPRKKNKEIFRTISLDKFSRARMPEPEVELQAAPEPEKKEAVSVSPAPAPAEKAEIKTEDKPVISAEMFSRAPLKKTTVKKAKE